MRLYNKYTTLIPLSGLKIDSTPKTMKYIILLFEIFILLISLLFCLPAQVN